MRGQLLLRKLARKDVDTICAFDYKKMKDFAVEGHGLQYKDYHPSVQGIKVPELIREE